MFVVTSLNGALLAHLLLLWQVRAWALAVQGHRTQPGGSADIRLKEVENSHTITPALGPAGVWEVRLSSAAVPVAVGFFVMERLG